MGAKTKKTNPEGRALHPNSRKAGQVIKKLAHENRVSVSKKARNARDTAALSQVGWFHDAIFVRDRVLCPHEFDILIEKFLSRNQQDIEDLSSSPNVKDMAKVDALRRLHVDEDEKYSGPGIEVPDLLSNKGFSAVKDWDGNSKDLPRVIFKKYRRAQLLSATLNDACKKSVSCPKVRNDVPMEDVETQDNTDSSLLL